MRPDDRLRFRWWIVHVALPLIALAIAANVLGRTELDVRSLEPFFDRRTNEFPLRNVWVFHDVMHLGGKYLVIAAGSCALVLALVHWRRPAWRVWRFRLLYLVACVGISVAIAGSWKHLSHQTTPYDTTRFGGPEPWPGTPSELPWLARFGSPGAHAAAGFAWLALYYVGASLGADRRWLWLAPGFLLGTLLAIAQHLRGAHVPSHELWSLAIAWAVASGVAWLFRKHGWMDWRETEDSAPIVASIPSAMRAEPWLLGASGVLLGVFIFQADVLLEMYAEPLEELHAIFERIELVLMGPGLGVATFLAVERLLTTRERALERELAERQRRFQILGQMAASVAHEVRNPLHSLRLILDEQRHDVPALASHPLRGDLEGCLQRIDNAVDLVYTLARPGADESASADLAAIVRDAITTLERSAPAGPSFALDRFPDTAGVSATPARVRIVVENILRNAHRASAPNDRVGLTLMRERTDWVLDVRNSGQLHPASERAAANERASPGLGLGLSISRHIVADAGGHIELGDRDGFVHCVVHWPVSAEALS